jgi:hypothetical protein
VGADDTPDRRGTAGANIGPARGAQKGRPGGPEHECLTDDRQRFESRWGRVAVTPADANDQGGEMIHQPPHHTAIQDWVSDDIVVPAAVAMARVLAPSIPSRPNKSIAVSGRRSPIDEMPDGLRAIPRA